MNDTRPEPHMVELADAATVTTTVGRATTVDGFEFDHLRRRLAADAEREGLLDVAVTTVDSPVGALLVAATTKGVVRVAFEREDHDAVVEQLASVVSARILRLGRRTDDTARQLDEYFAGRRRTFEVAVDLRLVRGFRLAVVAHLKRIAFGTTASYAAVAGAVGHPGAVRAVGTACAGNPVPVLLPCHRVVRSDGTIGGYRGGPAAKRTLLDLEAAAS